MAKTKPLPETIYVVRDTADDTSWLSANEEVADLVGDEDDPPVLVGTYELTGTRRLTRVVAIVAAE